jgi:hypothetical protein
VINSDGGRCPKKFLNLPKLALVELAGLEPPGEVGGDPGGRAPSPLITLIMLARFSFLLADRFAVSAFMDSSMGLVGPASTVDGGVCPNIRSSLLARLL